MCKINVIHPINNQRQGRKLCYHLKRQRKSIWQNPISVNERENYHEIKNRMKFLNLIKDIKKKLTS